MPRSMFQSISIVGAIFTLFVGAVSAQTLGTATEPARLRDLEPLIVQLIYVVWGFGTLGLTFILAFIGFLYMTSLGDSQKQQEIKDRAGKWLISVLIFYLAYPLLLTIYGIAGIGDSNSDCYEDIGTPGFHFFFPDICTDPQSGSIKYAAGSDCSNLNQEELDLLAGKNRCCLESRMIVEQGNCIERVYPNTNSGQSATFYVSSTVNGSCTLVSNSSCDPEYLVTYVGPGGGDEININKIK